MCQLDRFMPGLRAASCRVHRAPARRSTRTSCGGAAGEDVQVVSVPLEHVDLRREAGRQCGHAGCGQLGSSRAGSRGSRRPVPSRGTPCPTSSAPPSSPAGSTSGKPGRTARTRRSRSGYPSERRRTRCRTPSSTYWVPGGGGGSHHWFEHQTLRLNVSKQSENRSWYPCPSTAQERAKGTGTAQGQAAGVGTSWRLQR